MRTKKRVFTDFAFYDRTGMQKYLEKQALKGWRLFEIKGNNWSFTRIEPRKLSYGIAYYPNASEGNTDISENQQIFIDMCGQTGWNLAARSGALHVFFNLSEDPVPINTDAALEIEMIHKTMKKTLLSAWFRGMALCGFVILLRLLSLMLSPVDRLASYMELFVLAYHVILFAVVLLMLSKYYCWLRKAKLAAQMDNSTTPTKSYPYVSLIMAISVLFIMILAFAESVHISVFVVGGGCGLFIVIMLLLRKMLEWDGREISLLRSVAEVSVVFLCAAVLVTFLVLPFFINNSRTDTYTYEGKQYDVYNDVLPLRIEDIEDNAPGGYSYKMVDDTQTFMLRYVEAKQIPRKDTEATQRLSYRIATVKIPLLYDWCANAMLRETKGYQITTRNIEGAETVYYCVTDKDHCWLICYENKIVELKANWMLSEEQVIASCKIIREY